MTGLFRRFSQLACCCAIPGMIGSALAADLPRPLAGPAEVPIVAASPWTFRFVPYGWLTSLKGEQTVRGRTIDVDASFVDIVEESDTLAALMGTFEVRNGPFGLYGDLVWSKVELSGDEARSRSFTGPLGGNISATLEASLGLDIQMAIVEGGASYEIIRSGPFALDILGGVRYWHQKADASLDLTLTVGVDVLDLELVGNRAFARSGSVDWIDPLIGARLRYEVAPGHQLFLRGDVGGFGVGSDFSWQAIGGYGFDFARWHGITFSGVLGYRALYVDYSEGEGQNRYGFDMLQHGPVLGVSMRF